MSSKVSIMDINPLEHLTSDVAISNYNYESIMNGLVNWNNSKMDTITIRLATTTDPYFVDYTIPTKHSYDVTSGTAIARTFLKRGLFAYKERYDISAAFDPDGTKTDKLTLRFTVNDNGGTNWELYQINTVYDEVTSKTVTEQGSDVSDLGIILTQNDTFKHDYIPSLFFRRSVVDGTGHGHVVLYKTLKPVSAGDTILEGDNCVRYVQVSEDGVLAPHRTNVTQHGCQINYGDKVYVQSRVHEFDDSKRCSSYDSGMTAKFDVYNPDETYEYGNYVYFNGEYFMYTSDTATEDLAPYDEELNDNEWVRSYNDETWKRIFLEDTYVKLSASKTLRYSTNTDISGFILQNSSNESNEATNINVNGSLRISGGETKEHTGLAIFETSNYTNWPSNTPKWNVGSAYTTDTEKSVYELQGYSAKMVFNHADPTIKYKNIINYDGPDLDQGLCIFLPVNVAVKENDVDVVKTPEDGTMIEFLFRIWPDPTLNGNVANDLIINKSQIYVYNIDDYVDFNWKDSFSPNNVFPIAKFSMARMTNFYVFAENIGVPDKPVLYKARFIYSKTDGRWKTYDYYQMPDHIFLSPLGFVDPSTEEAFGVQTAGFPLYQDPFSNYNLMPLHADDGYLNRITEFVSEDNG